MGKYEKANEDDLIFKLDKLKVFDEDRIFKPEASNGEVLFELTSFGFNFICCYLNRLPYQDELFEDIRDTFDNGFLTFTVPTNNGTNAVMVVINKAIDDLGVDFRKRIFCYSAALFVMTSDLIAKDIEFETDDVLYQINSALRIKFGEEEYQTFVDTAHRNNVKVHVNNMKVDF